MIKFKDIKQKPQLIVMVGIPKSGKSTYVDHNFPDYQLICADDFRLALGVQYNARLEGTVWAAHDIALRAAMERGCSTVIDNTNTTTASLNKFEALTDEYGYTMRIVHISTPSQVCLERNVVAEKDKVPGHVINRMHEQLKTLMKTDVYQRNLYKRTAGI